MTQTMSQDLTDEQYELADAIEAALEKHTTVGEDAAVSQIARWIGGQQDPEQLRLVLAWMEARVYVVSNGRGGCWRRYGRRK
jgi:hypothetical protein